MQNDDDLVFLNQGEDDEIAVFQTQAERNNILNQLHVLENDDADHDLETTIQMTQDRQLTPETRPYWRKVFG